jgi:hypothetical protein
MSKPTVISRGTMRFQTSGNGGTSFNGLLIKASLIA